MYNILGDKFNVIGTLIISKIINVMEVILILNLNSIKNNIILKLI